MNFFLTELQWEQFSNKNIGLSLLTNEQVTICNTILPTMGVDFCKLSYRNEWSQDCAYIQTLEVVD